jgi:hypothetical protein
MTIIDLINLWLLGGGKDTNVPPFRFLSPINVKHFDAGGKRFSKFKQVMKFVEKLGVRRMRGYQKQNDGMVEQ